MTRRATLIALAVMALVTIPAAGGARAGTAPVVTISPSGVLTPGTQTIAFDQDVHAVSSSNVAVRVEGTSSNIAATLACFLADGVTTTGCDDTPPHARVVKLSPSSPLIPGQRYVVVVDPAGVAPVTNATGDAAPATTMPFSASGVEQESSVAARYFWRSITAGGAYDGSYRTTRQAGMRAVYRFNGTWVTWYSVAGPSQGSTRWWIDGNSARTYSDFLASGTRMRRQHSVSGLAAGPHTLIVESTGGPSSHPYTSLDRFHSSSAATDAAYTWLGSTSSHASGGRFFRSAEAGTRATFRFRGPGIDWYTVTGPDQGIADVLVDGKRVAEFSDYSAAQQFGVRRSIKHLSDAVHTLTILVTGSHHTPSRGNTVAIDRWSLKAPISMFRGLGVWVDLFDYAPGCTSTTTGCLGTGVMANLKARGVRTIFIETGRYNSKYTFGDTTTNYASTLRAWVSAAHANGIRIVGWYFPGYDTYLSRDVARAAAIAGLGFDALAVDIESCTCDRSTSSGRAKFNSNIVTQLSRVRNKVGIVYPIAAITPSPVGMSLAPTHWTGFPWKGIGRYSDVVMPMAYWSYRRSAPSQCSASHTTYCAYNYTKQNVAQARALTGLPVHDIGGVSQYKLGGAWHTIPSTDIKDFVRAALEVKPYGASFYDYRTTASSWWPQLEKLEAL